MFAKPPRWIWTFSQPAGVWKPMPGYPNDRHVVAPVLVTRHSVLIVPAAPCEESTVTRTVRSEQRAMAGVCDRPTLGGWVAGTGWRPKPNARVRAYVPPPTPARTTKTSATTWGRRSRRRG